MQTNTNPDTGMELRDLLEDQSFHSRPKRPRDSERESIALRRLSRLFAESPEIVLQELVDIAVKFSGADSSGISLEETDRETFRWIVVSGSFACYLNGTTPRHYSPCGTCLDANRPQLYKVTQPYYEYLGVEAKPITEGLLLPWSNEFFRGTLWAVSHSSEQTFCFEDYEFLNSLADFASIIVRYQRQQQLLREAQNAQGAAEMAHRLAHRINNPLQSLTNTLYIAQQGGPDILEYLAQAQVELEQLTKQVALLLQQPARSKTDNRSASGTTD